MELDILEQNIVVSTMNVDYSSQTLTLFEGLSAQKGRLFNALFFWASRSWKPYSIQRQIPAYRK